MSNRVSPFGDLNDFAPAPKGKATKKVQKEVVDQVAAENGFPSRQPVKTAKVVKAAPSPAATAPAPAAKEQRRYRTGRNQQINLKATGETIEHLYRLADEMNVPLGEVLARALVALEKSK